MLSVVARLRLLPRKRRWRKVERLLQTLQHGCNQAFEAPASIFEGRHLSCRCDNHSVTDGPWCELGMGDLRQAYSPKQLHGNPGIHANEEATRFLHQ